MNKIKNLVFICIQLAIYLIGSYNASAQPQTHDCYHDPECINVTINWVPYNDLSYRYFRINVNCVVKVEFDTATVNCNGYTYPMIKIKKITKLGNCSSLDVYEIIREVHKQLLWYSGALFNLPYAWLNIKIINPSCVEESGNDIEQCGDYCCTTSYRVEGEDSSLYVTSSSPDQSQFSCDSPCVLTCDTVAVPPGPIVGPPISQSCDGNCNEQWINKPNNVHYSIIRDGQNNEICRLAIFYEYRYCDPYWEYRIDRIIFYGTNCSDITALYRKALNALLWVAIGEHDTWIRLRNPSCWTIWDEHLIIPCENGRCCHTLYETFKWYIDLIEYRYAKVYTHESNYYDCGEEYDCTFMCDYQNEDFLDDPLYGTEVLPKIASPDINNKDKQTTKETFKTYIKPNPVTGKADIILESSENGLMKLTVFDVHGNTIYSNNQTKDAHQIIWEFDTGEIPNGAYYYQIQTETGVLIKSSFIINH